MGIEGKVHATYGDFILLKSAAKEAGGFVVSIDDKSVKLSLQNPLFTENSGTKYSKISYTSGNRTYRLSEFESCEVLRPNNQ